MTENNSPSTFLSVLGTIEKICRSHVAIADYDYGDLQVFNAKNYKFPLAYLETVEDLRETQRGATHIYTIALNLVDRRSQDGGAPEFTQIQDRLHQLFFELKLCMQLEYFFHMERVGPADILVFPDFSDAQTIRLRAEFQIEVDCEQTDYPDLEAIFPTLFGLPAPTPPAPPTIPGGKVIGGGNDDDNGGLIGFPGFPGSGDSL